MSRVNLKDILKGVGIGFPVAIVMTVTSIHYLNLIDNYLREKYQTEKIVYIEKEKVEFEDNDDVLGEEKIIEEDITTVVGIDEMKRRLFSLIPDKYEVIEAKENYPGIYDDGCVSLYELYPKDYSELEKKYFDSAYIQYCKDIHTATLTNQIGEVRYNEREDSWFYYDGEDTLGVIQEKKTYGSNVVSISEQLGSHHSFDAYIVRLDSSDEVIMLLIPQFTRIRCEEYDENGVETLGEECVNFLNSLKRYDGVNDWVSNEVYDKDYEDLLEILKSI